MKRNKTLQQILWSHLDNLSATLQPNTVAGYATTLRRFVDFLQTSYPEVRKPSHLRRDPHILGFLQTLHQQQPPLKNGSRIHYIINLRRLLHDLPQYGYRLPPEGLILEDDFPLADVYLPKPLSLEDDRLLLHQLTADNDLIAHALLLMRATGMRVGECRYLTQSCLQSVGQHQWVLKLPLGKLHTERWLPVDEHTRRIIDRILFLRGPDSQDTTKTNTFLLLWRRGRRPAYQTIRNRLAQAAQRAGCSSHVTPHRLRHYLPFPTISRGYATWLFLW